MNTQDSHLIAMLRGDLAAQRRSNTCSDGNLSCSQRGGDVITLSSHIESPWRRAS